MLLLRPMSEIQVGEVVCAFKADGDFAKGKALSPESGVMCILTETSVEPATRYVGFVRREELWNAVVKGPVEGAK